MTNGLLHDTVAALSITAVTMVYVLLKAEGKKEKKPEGKLKQRCPHRCRGDTVPRSSKHGNYKDTFGFSQTLRDIIWGANISRIKQNKPPMGRDSYKY